MFHVSAFILTYQASPLALDKVESKHTAHCAEWQKSAWTVCDGWTKGSERGSAQLEKRMPTQSTHNWWQLCCFTSAAKQVSVKSNQTTSIHSLWHRLWMNNIQIIFSKLNHLIFWYFGKKKIWNQVFRSFKGIGTWTYSRIPDGWHMYRLISSYYLNLLNMSKNTVEK